MRGHRQRAWTACGPSLPHSSHCVGPRELPTPACLSFPTDETQIIRVHLLASEEPIFTRHSGRCLAHNGTEGMEIWVSTGALLLPPSLSLALGLRQQGTHSTSVIHALSSPPGPEPQPSGEVVGGQPGARRAAVTQAHTTHRPGTRPSCPWRPCGPAWGSGHTLPGPRTAGKVAGDTKATCLSQRPTARHSWQTGSAGGQAGLGNADGWPGHPEAVGDDVGEDPGLAPPPP